MKETSSKDTITLLQSILSAVINHIIDSSCSNSDHKLLHVNCGLIICTFNNTNNHSYIHIATAYFPRVGDMTEIT